MQLRPQGRSSFQVLVPRDLGLAFWGLSEVPAREKFGVILGLYWDYIGRMEKKMETTIE